MLLFPRGQSQLPSPVVRDDEVTIAARRRKKVACILHTVFIYACHWNPDLHKSLLL